MLILLPPSEGKGAPRRGKALDLDTLAFPSLAPARERVLDALVELCATRPDEAGELLGVPASQPELVARNAALRESPTARADAVYTGVLYDALGFADLSPAARRRATSRLAITSSLFGLVAPGDRIPTYRLSGDASLPGLGPVAAVWREAMAHAADVEPRLGRGLIVDLRSSTYAAFWRPPAERARSVATVRVLHEADGKRSIVSHFNKATKGRLVRDLLEDGRDAATPKALARLLGDLGWHVEPGEPDAKGTRLDVVVTALGG